MTAVAYFATKELNFSLNAAIWECPLIQILLMIRQHCWINDQKQMTLSDIEKISAKADWDKLIEENRRQIYLQLNGNSK